MSPDVETTTAGAHSASVRVPYGDGALVDEVNIDTSGERVVITVLQGLNPDDDSTPPEHGFATIAISRAAWDALGAVIPR